MESPDPPPPYQSEQTTQEEKPYIFQGPGEVTFVYGVGPTTQVGNTGETNHQTLPPALPSLVHIAGAEGEVQRLYLETLPRYPGFTNPEKEKRQRRRKFLRDGLILLVIALLITILALVLPSSSSDDIVFPVANFTEDGQVTALAVSGDWKSLFSAHDSVEHPSYEIKQTDIGMGQLVGRFIGHKGVVNVIRISDDSRRMFSGDRNGGVFIWDLTAVNQSLLIANISNIIATPPSITYVHGIAVIDNHLSFRGMRGPLSLGGGGIVIVVDISNLTQPKRLFDVSPPGTGIWARFCYGLTATSNRSMLVWTDGHGKVTSMPFPYGNITTLQTPNLTMSIATDEFTTSVSSNNTHVFIYGDQQLTAWDTTQKELKYALTIYTSWTPLQYSYPGHKFTVPNPLPDGQYTSQCLVSPDGSQMFCFVMGKDHEIWQWAFDGSKPVRKFRGISGKFGLMAMAPEQEYLYFSGQRDEKVMMAPISRPSGWRSREYENCRVGVCGMCAFGCE